MSVPMQYHGHGSRMSAELKQMTKRVRAARPDLFVPFKRSETRMDGEGQVTTTVVTDVKAVPIKPSVRHAMSMRGFGR